MEYFFQAARLPEGETFYSSMRAVGESLTITVSRPLYEDGAFSGVVAATLMLRSFNDILATIDYEEDVEIHLLDTEGLLLASSESAFHDKLASFVFIPPVQVIMQGETQSGISSYTRQIDERQVFGSARRIEKTGWIIVIEHDRQVALDGLIENQRYNLMMAGFITLMALLLGFLFSDRISTTLQRIIEKTHEMRTGNLSSPIRVGGSKEFISLAESYNEMASQLDDSMRGLKDQITSLDLAEKVLRQRSLELEKLLEVTSTLARTHDPTAQLDFVANTCVELLEADECCIINLVGNRSQYTTITRASARRFEGISRTIGEIFIRPSVPALYNDIQQKEGIAELVNDDDVEVHLVSAPLFVTENQIGEILLVRLGGAPFERRHLNLLEGIAQQTAQAIDSLRMVSMLESYSTSLEKAVARRTEELRAANENLRRLSQLKDEFISNVSHELRTPLTNLKLRGYLLSQQPDSIDKHLAVFRRETDRLQAIVENLLTISSLDQSQVGFTPVEVDINDLVNAIAADREMLIRSQGKSFKVTPMKRACVVQGDMRMLEQVLSILLTNAMSYTPEGGRITISTVSRSVDGHKQVGFSVKDTGIGISRQDQERIFERFYRGTAAETTNTPGTGLGLSIARQIVERHHGSIEIESSGIPGEGSSFTVWLPAA